MTASSSPVTYGSPDYKLAVDEARGGWCNTRTARALLAADERARANEAKYLAEVAAHGRSSQTLTYNVELRIAAEARAEAAEAEAKSAHEDWEIAAGQCRAAEARCAESFRAGIEAAAKAVRAEKSENASPSWNDALDVAADSIEALTPPAPESKPDDDGRCTATFSGAWCIFRAGHEGMHEPVSRGMRWP